MFKPKQKTSLCSTSTISFFLCLAFLVSTKSAQHRVHWMLGILRHFRAVFPGQSPGQAGFEFFSAPRQSPRPPQRHSPQGKSAHAYRWAFPCKYQGSTMKRNIKIIVGTVIVAIVVIAILGLCIIGVSVFGMLGVNLQTP